METEPSSIVRYNPMVGGLVLVVGVANTVLGFLSAARGDSPTTLVIGLLFLLLGTLLLVRPYFRVAPGAVEIVGMTGIGGSEYPYRKLAIVEGKLTTLRADGTPKRVPVQRWFARRGDWEAMAATVEDVSRAPER